MMSILRHPSYSAMMCKSIKRVEREIMFTGPPDVSGGSDIDEEGPRSTAETEASTKGASGYSIGEEEGSEDSGVLD